MVDFQTLFRGLSTHHGEATITNKKNARGKNETSYSTQPGEITAKLWEGHFKGTGVSVGVIPLLDDNENVYWGVIDIDKYDGLDVEALEKDCEGLPVTITRSKSGGVHLWVFFSEPVPAKSVYEKLTEWAAALGYSGEGTDIFPCQFSRTPGTVGNFVNLPYYGDTRKCYYKGEEIPIEGFLQLAEKRMLPREVFEKIELHESSQQFSDGPPCLQTLVTINNVITEGGRNNALFNVGIYLHAKFPDSELSDLLSEWNKVNVSPPLPRGEIDAMAKMILSHEYNYKCSAPPIKAHCNRNLCIKRQFGVARGGLRESELNVEIKTLTKYNMPKPRWEITINGTIRRIETNDLLNQNKFATIVVETSNILLNPITTDKWRELVSKLLEKVVILEMAYDATPEGQFYNFLNTYIQQRKTDNKDSLAKGNVWVEDNVAYFNSTHLMQYLRREGFRDLDIGEIFILLKKNGVDRKRFNIKGQTVACWCLPFDNLQKAPFDKAEFGKNVFGENKDGEGKESGSVAAPGHQHETAEVGS